MKKIIRTNERCYICDFGRAVEEDDDNPKAGEVLPSIYLDSLSNGPSHEKEWEYQPEHRHYHRYQDSAGRYVFIDPRDGKPVCTQCAEEALASVEEMKIRDNDWKPLTWREESQDSEDIMDVGEQVGYFDSEGFHVEPGLSDKDRDNITQQVDDWNIDWGAVERWDNGNIRFPLPLKDTPRPLGDRWHTRAQKYPLTDWDREQIRRILHGKGQKKD